ncbi:MAG TPA: gliding motility-associated C-terminal domain-containing protein [Flavobacteriales bacterium]|nr:gliding motility-associated C-terminal domain-containing protein [Flavobacteriales bacterium]
MIHNFSINIRTALRKLFVLTGLLLLLPQYGNSTHLLGGDITWTCDGTGNYVFQLRIFRDCSGPSISIAGQSLRVWNHPSITQIPLIFVSQSDNSPVCTQVAGGPVQITCASGNPNAVEEYIFRSTPVNLNAVPPAQGFAFTWDAFSRPACDNLQNALIYGLTLRSFMYSNGGANSNPCNDSSPQFTSSPQYAFCAGEAANFGQNAYDPDLDSVVFSWGTPIDQIAAGTFNPPAFPIAVPYSPNYSITSPLPGTALNASNVPGQINPATGDISFTSFTTGKFNIVVKADSYRNGVLVSEVYREFLMVIVNCGPNTAPSATPVFGGGTSWSGTFLAGDLIQFNLVASDPELLQDGSPESVIMTATGLQFGTNFTDPANGCINAPCATLSNTLPQTGVQGLSTDFNWQTTCDHIPAGATQSQYSFTFFLSDDYCSVPGANSFTANITLLAPPSVPSPDIRCADVAPNGDVTLSWNPSADPQSIFDRYEIYNSGTLIATLPAIGTNSFTHVGADAHLGIRSYHIITYSDCGGIRTTYSDTISTMFLQVNNPANGTAQLVWNPLRNPSLPSASAVYEIYREFPLGTWTLINTVPATQHFYSDTITVCDDSLNYRIEISDALGCHSTSSIDGKTFQDQIAPYIPVITSVTVDTTSGLANINWEVNAAGDTQGYIILQNQGGNWIIIDTVYGVNNTTYEYALSLAGLTSESYGIAAFDSCFSGNPPTANTSAMGTFHSSIYLTTSLNICAQRVTLNWNPYINWTGGVANYEIYASENGGAFQLIGNTNATNFVHQNVNRLSTFCYLVIAYENGTTERSLSNRACRFIAQPSQPAWNYLQTATVSGNNVEVRCFTDLSATVLGYRIERTTDLSLPFDPIGTAVPSGNPVSFFDYSADVGSSSYYYRAIAIDSCGQDALVSNNGKTILLTIDANSLRGIVTLQWNAYQGWDGFVTEYRIYRSSNGVFDPAPIATVLPGMLFYEDDVSMFLESDGEICYYVEAVESLNSFGIAETSISNLACAVIEPIVWVPNAFMVGGVNEIFIPVISFADYSNYQLRIFDRWGQIVFETNDRAQGWDGKINNQLGREGVYVWVLEFADGSGQLFEKKGFVTLLKAPK